MSTIQNNSYITTVIREEYQREQVSISSWETLDINLLKEVFSYLSSEKNLLRCSLVHRRWREAGSDHMLWKSLFFRIFSPEKFPLDRSLRTRDVIMGYRAVLEKQWEVGMDNHRQFELEQDELVGMKVQDGRLFTYSRHEIRERDPSTFDCLKVYRTEVAIRDLACTREFIYCVDDTTNIEQIDRTGRTPNNVFRIRHNRISYYSGIIGIGNTVYLTGNHLSGYCGTLLSLSGNSVHVLCNDIVAVFGLRHFNGVLYFHNMKSVLNYDLNSRRKLEIFRSQEGLRDFHILDKGKIAATQQKSVSQTIAGKVYRITQDRRGLEVSYDGLSVLKGGWDAKNPIQYLETYQGTLYAATPAGMLHFWPSTEETPSKKRHKG